MAFIGIDDTDNKESRGTGYHSRLLADYLVKNNIADVLSVSRHQLYFHPDIPYTSHNSSACLMVKTKDINKLIQSCKKFMLSIIVPGCDTGLCIAKEESIDEEVIEYSIQAKSSILNQKTAKNLAAKHKIYLEGLAGTRDGIIGSLAAVGLRKSGDDGRCIWLKGKDLREINGIFTGEDLFNLIYLQQICDMQKIQLAPKSRIFIDNWLRPVLMDKKVTIIANSEKTDNYEWRIASKDYIKNISD